MKIAQNLHLYNYIYTILTIETYVLHLPSSPYFQEERAKHNIMLRPSPAKSISRGKSLQQAYFLFRKLK